jgi:hypothetical protein
MKHLLNPKSRIYSRVLAISLCIFLVGMLFTTCNKSKVAPGLSASDQKQLISSAKQFFETSVAGTSHPATSSYGNSFNMVRDADKHAVWSRAYVLPLGSQNAVVVPINFPNNMSAKSSLLDSSKRLPINCLFNLLIYKDAGTNYHAEVISGYPDKACVSNPKGPFTGILHVQNWNGDFLKGYKYTGSKIMAVELNNSQSGAKVAPDLAGPGVQTLTYCDVEDFYSCQGTDDDPYQYCEFLYEENLGCTTVDVTNGSTTGTITETEYEIVPQSGGSTSAWNEGPNLSKLCGTYSFATVANAYYCEITSLDIMLVGTGYNQGEVLNYVWGGPCFSFPKSLTPTTAQASAALNAAWNQAVDRITQDANSNNVIGDLQVKLNMQKYMNSYLNKFYPGATFNPQGCSGNIPMTKPQYCTVSGLQ